MEGAAEDRGQRAPARRHRHPQRQHDPDAHPGERPPAARAPRREPEQEQPQHPAAEDAGQRPPGVERAPHPRHRQRGRRPREPPHDRRQPQDGHGAPLARRWVDVALVVVAQEDRRRRVEAGRDRAHRGREDRGDQQPRDAGRQHGHDVPGEDPVGPGRVREVGRQRARVRRVEGEERGPDEEERRRERDVGEAAQPHALGRLRVRARRDVALHVVLVDAEVLQVDDQPVEQHHPHGGLTEARSPGSQAELVVGRREAEQLRRALGQPGHGQDRAEDRPRHQHHRLERVGVDDGDQASHQRVDRHRHAGRQDDGAHVPPKQRAQRQRHEVHDGAHPRELRQQVAQARVAARPRAEPPLEVLVGRHVRGVPVERHEPPGRDPGGERDRQAEDEGVPVAGERLGRQRQEGDAADVGPEDGQPGEPPRQAAAGRGEPLHRPAPPGDGHPHGHGRDEVAGEDDEIERGDVRVHRRGDCIPIGSGPRLKVHGWITRPGANATAANRMMRPDVAAPRNNGKRIPAAPAAIVVR